MGNGIAQVFAQAGFDVSLQDAPAAALERARATIDKSLSKFVEKGKLSAEARDETLGRLQTVPRVEALHDVDFVVEAILEDAAAKRALFGLLDQLTRPGGHPLVEHVLDLHHR